MEKEKVTAALVEANSKASFEIQEEQQIRLLDQMEPTFKGLLSAEEIEGFWNYRQTYYEQIVRLDSFKDSPALHDIIKELMNYSISLMNHSPFALFLSFLKHFKPEQTKEDTDKALYFAWALYTMDSIYLTMDDILDGAAIRRFKSAYHIENGSNVTWMRSLLLLHLTAEGLQHKFKNDSYGYDLNFLFAYYTSRSSVGQLLDLESFKSSEHRFDMEYRLHHNDCMTSAVYSLPLEVAALMGGRKLKTSEVELIRNLAFTICNLFRDNNDLVDSFPTLPHGKPLYSDIRNGTCSWLSATAWKIANEEQRGILKENYGFTNNEKVAKVLQVYCDLDMTTQFQLELPAKIEKIKTLVDEFPEYLAPRGIFAEVLAFAQKDLCLAWS